MNDCGCGGGKDCITKNKKDFKKWVKAEMKKLDCGCGCKGKKKFEEKYGKLVGGALTKCPEGWRTDALTCVKNCEPGEKDDGLTCRKPCPAGYVDDGLTCRKPITSSMNECPPGSKDIWGTCWGPVRKDCIHDCFKHPAKGCSITKCGRLVWAGVDWGPKLCASCDLNCGLTCWDAWGITKQLHERELKLYGGEVIGKSIYLKEIRSRVDWVATGKNIEDAFKEAFGDDSLLAKAFDPEKNGVAEAFRKFGKDTKEAVDSIGTKLTDSYKRVITPDFKRWLKLHENSWKRAMNRLFPPAFVETLKDPDNWIEVAIFMAEISAVIIASAISISTFGAGTPAAAGLVMAVSMIGPSVRMIVKASKGESIDAFDIAELVLASIPAAGTISSKAVVSGTFATAMRFLIDNRSAIQLAGNIIISGAKFGQAIGKIPSTCIANCPETDNRPFPPKDNDDPIYIPPAEIPPRNPNPPPTFQKTDAEILAMAPGNRPFTKFLTDSDEVNPDYKGTPIKWIKKKRFELYKYGEDPDPSKTTPVGDAGTIVTPEDKQIEDATKVDENTDEVDINDDDEIIGFGRFFGKGIENMPLIEAEQSGNTIINPFGETSNLLNTSTGEIPKGPGSCEFNVKCYAQNYPDLYNTLQKDDGLMTAYWRDVGKKDGHNPCCGAKLVMGKNYEEEHVKCNSRNGFFNKETKRCDISKNTKGIKKTSTQFNSDICKADGNFWDGTKCDETKNLEGKVKIEEAARIQAEANKRALDRAVETDFFPDCYAANNPQVVTAVGSSEAALEKHFREFGWKEQLSSKCDLNLQERKEAAVKTKALANFNAYCYAYNNPEVFDELSKPYFAKSPRDHPSVLADALKNHYATIGYAQKLSVSCSPRDSDFNWKCFAENIRTVPGYREKNVNLYTTEREVNRQWEQEKNSNWETFNKGSCKQDNLRKAKELREFNAKCYAFNNPELVAQFGEDDEAYKNHFITKGFEEGLDGSCDIRNDTFKPECYEFANPDLAQKFGDNTAEYTKHWESTGRNEWRKIMCTPEQAQLVGQKHYCQDTESFWDPLTKTCDLTRHSNGRLKEEISKEVIDNYFNQFPENEREGRRNEWARTQDAAVQEYIFRENKAECNGKNNFFDGTCHSDRNPAGRFKKELCAEQNEYYDQIAGLCDPNRLPSGLTPQEEKKLEIDRERELFENEKKWTTQQRNCPSTNFWDDQYKICDPKRNSSGKNKLDLQAEECEAKNNYWTYTPAKCDATKDKYGNIKGNIPTPTGPSGPSNLTQTMKERNSIGLSWKNNGNYDNVRINWGTGSINRPGNTTTYIISNLNENTNYSITVTGYINFIAYAPTTGVLMSTGNPQGSGKPKSLTLYWAEWCPHCHDLIPIWKKLGSDYKGIRIEAIEEKQSKFKVNSYPTIIFRDGNNMEKYEGSRTKVALTKFLKNKLSN